MKNKEKLLLHICCAVCGAYLVELLKNNFDVLLYFYNPNIWPKEEFEKRLGAVKKLVEEKNLELVIGEYEHDFWLEKVKGFEKEPEGGKRCEICFALRLEKAADLALKQGIKNFTTTLAISPYKNEAVVNEIGQRIAKEKNLVFLSFNQIEALAQENKQQLWQKTRFFAKNLNLYHQKYCGCEFSLRKQR